ncbi:aspartate/glutamate racemase family protein [Microbacterium sp. NPDC077663]|uniref:aspartate/glutamate racemase family protein n=1 Tax=Microbacterium sp. NPDC077663 TaxID=3364189 RepID=UPI0037C89CD3
MTRVALLHTGAVVIGPIASAVRDALPDATVVNYLDDRIVADLGDERRAASVPERVADLVRAARRGGADVVMLTCSSISALAGAAAEAVGIPVLRIDEAMADDAVAYRRIAVVATLPTTLRPTVALLRERAERAGAVVEIEERLVVGAFDAVVSGDRDRHDALVVAEIERVAPGSDVVVLAQASMASAAEAAAVDVRVLSSVAPGVARLAQHVSEQEGRDG